MNKVVLGFSRKRGFAPISVLIRWMEKTNYSHTFIKIHSESLGEDLIYHAAGSQVTFINSDTFNEINEVVELYEHELSDEAKKVLLKFCVKQTGKPYGKMQLFGIALKRLIGLFGIRIPNPFSNGDRAFVCTELVFKALEQTGFVFFNSEEKDSMGLKDIKNAVSISGWSKISV